MKLSLPLLVLIFLACNSNHEITFLIAAEEFDLTHVPVSAELETGIFDENTIVCLQTDNQVIPAQIEFISDSAQRLWWIVNQAAGESKEYRLKHNEDCNSSVTFTWSQAGNQSKRLLQNSTPLIQYEYPVFDPDDIEASKKPYHHIFDPAGDRLITKGPGGLYGHHRGIFFGYNHVYTHDKPDTQIDIWHARDGERSEHSEFIKEFEGPVMGGHIVKIYWKDHNGSPFLEELRDIRVFDQPDNEILIDFRSTLTAIDGSVRLDGDLQHAGVQFRAAQYVADHAENTRFIRPEKWSHVPPDTEIGEADRLDLPWNAMHFQLENKNYTVAYMSHPQNPGGAEMSERRYGRFGEFFPYEVTENNPLNVHYRFWIKSGGEPSIDEIELRYSAFANPTVVTANY